MSTYNTYTQNLVFSSSSSQSATITTGYENIQVSSADLWVSSSSGPFTGVATLTFYNNSSMSDSSIVYVAQLQLASTTLSAGSTSSATMISLTTSSGFSPYNQLQVTTDGTNPTERRRIEAGGVSGNNVTVITPFTNAHNSGSVVSVLAEFSGMNLEDTSSADNIYVNVSFTSAQTLTLTLEVSGISVPAPALASSDTINTLVLRDGSGNFSASTITATLNGNASTATSATNITASSNSTLVTLSALSLPVSQLSGSFTQALTSTYSGTSGVSAFLFSGSPYGSGGSGNLCPPLLLLQDGTSSTTWNRGGANSGTYLGVNSRAAFTGNLVDFQAAGTSYFSIAASTGAVSIATSLTIVGGLQANGISMVRSGTQPVIVANSVLSLYFPVNSSSGNNNIQMGNATIGFIAYGSTNDIGACPGQIGAFRDLYLGGTGAAVLFGYSGGTLATPVTNSVTVKAGGGALSLNADSVLLGNASVTTSSTVGFPYLPAAAGAPSGTPASNTGYVAHYFDTTNLKLWVYTGGAWHYTQLT
jgi:hypothetical protein